MSKTTKAIRERIRHARGAMEQIGIYLDDVNDLAGALTAPEREATYVELIEVIDHLESAEDAARRAAGPDDDDDDDDDDNGEGFDDEIPFGKGAA